MSNRSDGKVRLEEERLQDEIKRIRGIEKMIHASGWQESIEAINKYRSNVTNEKLLSDEIKYNATTCNMMRRALLKYQNNCDYAQYEKELNERGLAIHKDRLS